MRMLRAAAHAAALGQMSIFTNKTCDVEQKATLTIGQGKGFLNDPRITNGRPGRKEKKKTFS